MTSPPARLLGLLEPFRAATEFASLLPASPLLASAPRGRGEQVIVLPGFTASDASTIPLRRFLQWRGFDARPWDLGRNLGFARMRDAVFERLDDAHRDGGPLNLVGWSLGGLLSRAYARRHPERVRRLVMIGSPIGGNPTQTAIWPLYASLDPARRREIEERIARMDFATPAAGVPSTAIYSRTDGIVPWQIARETPSAHTENIEVVASHLGLGVNPLVFYAVADRLAAEAWAPFAPPALLRLAYRTDTGGDTAPG